MWESGYEEALSANRASGVVEPPVGIAVVHADLAELSDRAHGLLDGRAHSTASTAVFTEQVEPMPAGPGGGAWDRHPERCVLNDDGVGRAVVAVDDPDRRVELEWPV